METRNTNKFNNSFGSVDKHSVTIHQKNGVEEIPINKISSVGFRQKRNSILGLTGTVGGLVAMFYLISQSHQVGGTEMLIGLIICLIIILGGVANLIGHHEILLGTAGENKRIKVEISKTKAGIDFVSAVRTAINNDAQG
jgi:hypothetical protein